MIKRLFLMKPIEEIDDKYELNIDIANNKVTYYVDSANENILDFIYDEQNFKDFLDYIKSYSMFCVYEKKDNQMSIEYKFLHQELKTKGSHSSFDIEEIDIDGDFNISEIQNLINNNRSLFSKCLIRYVKEYKLSDKSLVELRKINDVCPGILFKISGNDEYISLEDFEKALSVMNDFIDESILNRLSPLERLVYIYDKVRDREYIEARSDDYNDSRDLSRVLTSDEIVCAGFINIFNDLLTKYGIPCREFKMQPKDEGDKGHVRSVVYLKDEKYGIDGVYYCDPTWDCKFDSTNNYLYSYLYFCNTYDKMEQLDNYEFNYILSMPDDITYDEFIIAEDGNCPKIGFVSPVAFKNLNISKYLNCYNDLMNLKRFAFPFASIRDVQERLKFIKKKCLVPIKPEALLLAISNVRKILFYQEPEKYKYSRDVLYNILLNSEFGNYNGEERLMYTIFCKEYEEEYIPLTKEECRNIVLNLDKDKRFELDAERIKLTRVLKYLSEKKQNEEAIKLTKKN